MLHELSNGQYTTAHLIEDQADYEKTRKELGWYILQTENIELVAFLYTKGYAPDAVEVRSTGFCSFMFRITKRITNHKISFECQKGSVEPTDYMHSLRHIKTIAETFRKEVGK